MTEEEYAALPGIRWSHLVAMAESPLHYLHAVERGRRETPQLRLGRARHCALLEPERFRREWLVWDGDRRTKAWKQFRADHPDAEIVTDAEMGSVVAAVEAVRAHPVAGNFVRSLDDAELAVRWQDEATGLWCKARIDAVIRPFQYSRRVHLEFKSSYTLDPRLFAAHAARMGYHGGVAFHLDGLRSTGADVAPEPVMVVVESDPPYDVALFDVPDHVLRAGRELYGRLLARVAECQASGSWPGRAPGPVEFTLPDWAYADPTADGLGLDLSGLEG